MLSNYAVFDVETTGLYPHPGPDMLTEIGWLVIRGGVRGPARSLLIRIGRDVPEEAAAVTGITTEMLQEHGWPLIGALRSFLADVYGLLLITHNGVKFDSRFIDAACASAGLPPPAHRYYRDTAALFKGRALGLREEQYLDHWHFATSVLSVKRPGLKYNLQHCCDTLGIERSDVTAHRAAGGVELTRRLWEALTADVASGEA